MELSRLLFPEGRRRQRFNANPAELQSGPTAGLGGVFCKLGAAQENWIGLDYSIVPYGAGVLAHRFSLNFVFPPDLFKRPVVTQVSGPEAAKAAYDQGLRLLERGRNIDALVAFKTSLQADP